MNIDVPVHDSLQVEEVTDIYRTDDWWKAIVTYRFNSGAGRDETAVYLWHHDGEGWSQKNKYVIKTAQAWETDRNLIDQYIRSSPSSETTTMFPVSDYYTIGDGKTIFKEGEWWKAIVNVIGKGSYDTNEVMVYLWQKYDGEWRRRQKYAITSVTDWEKECELIDGTMRSKGATRETEQTEPSADSVSAELTTLDDELDAHLSEEFQ